MKIIFKKSLNLQVVYGILYCIFCFIILNIFKFDFNNKIFFAFKEVDYFIIGMSFVIFIFIKNPINKVFFIIWSIWPMLGNNYMYSLYLNYGHMINSLTANHIYTIYLFVFTLGLKTVELFDYKFLGKKICSQIVFERFINNKWIILICSIFPIISLMETKITLGYIPLFLKNDTGFVNYNLNLGFISSKLTLFGLISGIYLYLKLIKSKNKISKIFFVIIIFLDIIQMSADGARFRLLIFIITLFFINLKLNKKINLKKMFKYIIILCLIYVVGFIMRNPEKINLHNIVNNLSIIGGEYSDWTITVNSLNGLKLQNYDLMKSSIIKLFNPNILQHLGIDVVSWNSLSSATYFANFFNVPQNGIRIGIIGELNYAYNYWGIIIFYIFSLIVSKINIKIFLENNVDKVIFLSILSAYNLLTIMGQLNVLILGIKNIFFSYIIFIIIDKMTKQKNIKF